MTALTASSASVRNIQESNYSVHPVGASQTLFLGALVCLDPDTGDAIEATGTAQGHLRCVGVACGELVKGTTSPVVDNDATATSAGDVSVLLGQGMYTFVNDSSVSALTAADVGTICYAKDDATVSINSDCGNRAEAGIFKGLHDDGRCIVEVGGRGRFSCPVERYIANGALSINTIVALADDTGDAEVATATAITALVVGVVVNSPGAGDIAIVAVGGVAPVVVAAGGITAAARVTSTTAGAALDCTAADSHVGTALETGTSGQTKMVKIHIGNTLA